jgi:tetratricopeptide (TPR) repeat protein
LVSKSAPKHSGARKWAFRLAPIILLLLLPVLLEGALRLFGVGYSTSFLVREGDYWMPNEKFAQQFFGPRATSRPVYFKVPVQKAPDTIRIVVLGESAAMGTPDPAFSFGRILEVMLESRFPAKRIELINAAMRGIDSHIVRRIALDCARLKPDVFIVYMGNNEVIGLHGPEPGGSRLSQTLWVMRAGQFLKSARLGQILQKAKGERLKAEGKNQDMEFFRKNRLQPDDWRREALRRNFAANLRDICRVGPKVIVSTVPVNMKDFPPLGSLPGQWNAEEQFRLALSETNRAPEYYQRALDWDALQFRADTRLNETIRQVATNDPPLVDAVKTFAEADGGIPGAKLFRDHVHPTFEGDYLLAREFFWAVVRLYVLTPMATIPSRDECARLLAYTEWHDAQIQLAMADLTSRPPYHDQLNYKERQARAEKLARERLAQLTVPQVEVALEISRAAVKRRPDDWLLRNNCAQLYQALGRPAGAVEHLDAIVKLFPNVASFQILLGQALAAAGRFDAAIIHFENALKLDPQDQRAQQSLAQAQQRARTR